MDGQTYSYAQFFWYYWKFDTFTRKDLDDYWETLPRINSADQRSRGSTPGTKTKGMKMKAMSMGMKTKGVKKSLIRALTKKVRDLTERVAMLEFFTRDMRAQQLEAAFELLDNMPSAVS